MYTGDLPIRALNMLRMPLKMFFDTMLMDIGELAAPHQKRGMGLYVLSAEEATMPFGNGRDISALRREEERSV